MHLRLNWPGLITGFGLATANVHDIAMVPELAKGTQRVLLGDRNYWSPALSEELQGLTLLAPFKPKKRPLARRSCQTQPAPLPHWNRLQSVSGTLSNQAGPGQGHLASVLLVAA